MVADSDVRWTDARDYAAHLLSTLGVVGASVPEANSHHPAVTWAMSGAMALTGNSGGPPRMCPVALASYAQGVVMGLSSLAEAPLPASLDGARLLGERAAIAGYRRNGSISAGGTCQFVEASDGWIAINLARSDDWAMLSALCGERINPDWSHLASAIRDRNADDLVEVGRELGLPIAQLGVPASSECWFEIVSQPARAVAKRRSHPIVIDLSSLWAGPLCGSLLTLMGARVIKVESVRRPDGARFGPIKFFDLLNSGKESVALDFSTAAGREDLGRLIASADIVIEASRPRALRQLGISAETFTEQNPGLVWLSITGYGRKGEESQWVAFGDDAGVAAGLSAIVSQNRRRPIFCGDAIGDPLTGLHAALLAWSRWRKGHGGIMSIALRDVVAHCISYDARRWGAPTRTRQRTWELLLEQLRVPVASPIARRRRGSARPLGADTCDVLRGLEKTC